jgi:uncharacterized protein (DUF4415 family)
MRFTWDEAKRRSNLRKHGFDFAEVEIVFMERTVQESLTDWDRIDAMRDEDIDLSDAPEITEDMLKTAVWRLGGHRIPKGFKVVKVALDKEVIEYFKEQSGARAFWELMNDVLRERMLEDQAAPSRYRVLREEPTTPDTVNEDK